MTTAFKERYYSYVQEFEKILNRYLTNRDIEPEILSKSLKYSLQIGGKRFRPALMLAVADILKVDFANIENFALALELIHTYSLIHDDLPAMDNDDFRRGKPSNHKMFGEGQAVLAGDALLNEAYRILFSECKKGVRYIDAATMICENAGVSGMIAGQAADLFNEGKNCVDYNLLSFIIENKTAKMIISAVAVPAIIKDESCEICNIFIEFGKNLGVLFQITDDILDVTGDFKSLGKTLGKDAECGKISVVNVCGLEKSAKMADVYRNVCLDLLKKLPYDCGFLYELTDFVRYRSN